MPRRRLAGLCGGREVDEPVGEVDRGPAEDALRFGVAPQRGRCDLVDEGARGHVGSWVCGSASGVLRRSLIAERGAMRDGHIAAISAWLVGQGLAGASEAELVGGFCTRASEAASRCRAGWCWWTRSIPSTRAAPSIGRTTSPRPARAATAARTAAKPPRTGCRAPGTTSSRPAAATSAATSAAATPATSAGWSGCGTKGTSTISPS